jgi:hypothetical protein
MCHDIFTAVIFWKRLVRKELKCLTTDWTTGVRFLAKNFFCSICAQNISEAHPASNPVGTGGPFPGVEPGRGVTLKTHYNLVTSRMSWSYIFFPSWLLYRSSCSALLYFISSGTRPNSLNITNFVFSTW